jgi:hypothetical protein
MIKRHYFLDKKIISTEEFNKNKYIILPSNVLNVARILKIQSTSFPFLSEETKSIKFNFIVKSKKLYLLESIDTDMILEIYINI